MLQRQSFAPSSLGPAPAVKKRARPAHLPQLWLMVDARLGPALPRIIAHLPPRSAVIVRPYAMGAALGSAHLRTIRYLARARRHILLYAGTGQTQGYDGQHLGGGARPSGRKAGRIITMPVHDSRQAQKARRLGVDAVLISPIWPTRSHRGAPGIGLSRFQQLARQSGTAPIALGGMNASRFRQARRFGAMGWAGIDAFIN